MEDKELFEEVIELIISDNCSEDDLKACCDDYSRRGLKITYHRNETNIGADGNFEYCFHHASGKYTWLLGSDDIPMTGLLKEVIKSLNVEDIGLLHIRGGYKKTELIRYDSPEEMLQQISHWITYMSTNIFRTDYAKDVDLNDYKGSNLVQIPLYISACLKSKKNYYLKFPKLFEPNRDELSGYNLYEIFVVNFLSIYKRFENCGRISHKTYQRTKKNLFTRHIAPFTIRLKVLGEPTKLRTDNCYPILFKYYGYYWYVYVYLFLWLLWFLFKKVKK